MDIKEMLENEVKREREFSESIKQKLIGYLETVGFYETDVRRKSDGKVGRIKVSETSRFLSYELTFHLYTKGGELSKLQNGYIYLERTDMENINKLLETFELV